MAQPGTPSATVLQFAEDGRPVERLPYRIELCDDTDDRVERVLGRALNMLFACAMYRAALEENPERRIVLRRGRRMIADSTRD